MTPSPNSHDGNGLLARAVRRAAGASARFRKTAVVLWILLVVGCVAGGAMTGTKQLTEAQSGIGPSASADNRISDAGLKDPAVESILVKSSDAGRTRTAAADLERRVKALAQVAAVHGPADTPALTTAGGKAVLVQASLRGDPDDAGDNAKPLESVAKRVGAAHPGVTVLQSGPGSIDNAVGKMVEDDLEHAEVVSIPITLVILLLAFGALVAALVPLLLGITSVAAALGAVGVVSQIAPASTTTASVVVLIGLAVGVDYSLAKLRRSASAGRRSPPGTAASGSTCPATGAPRWSRCRCPTTASTRPTRRSRPCATAWRRRPHRWCPAPPRRSRASPRARRTSPTG